MSKRAFIAGILFFAAAIVVWRPSLAQRPATKLPAQAQPRQENVRGLNGTTDGELRPIQRVAGAFAVSPPVRSFGPARPDPNVAAGKDSGTHVRLVGKAGSTRNAIPGIAHDTDAALAKPLRPSAAMPLPTVNFDGISSDDVANASGFRVLPPDTNGDVGPDHYVQAVNTLLRVFNKTGTPVGPAFKPSALFAPLATACSGRDDGEPIVLYDPLADRWLFSQYCNLSPPFRQMIAVSQTGDPTGSYYLYEFIMPNNLLNDYSKFGVWPNGYYMTDDQFVGSDYVGPGVFAFDRDKMLRGDPTASYIYFDLAIPPAATRTGGMLPADLDGINPPPPGSPAVFATYSATEYGDPADALRLFNFAPNFVNPEASTFAERAESPIAVAAFDPTSNPGRDDIFEPPPGEHLDAQSDRLMSRVVYRNQGDHESLLVQQTVRVSGAADLYQAGVRYYELRRDSSPGPFSVFDQATYGNLDGLSQWMGSAALDHQGNLAFGFSLGNQEKAPSVAYAGRSASDPPGTLRDSVGLAGGAGVQTAFGFRWGDYTAMNVDPVDDCSFWYTGEYYTPESQAESPFGWLTRIGSFAFPQCTPVAAGTIQGTVINSISQAAIAKATLSTGTGYTRATNAAGQYGPMRVIPGGYTLTASAPGYRSKTVPVTVGNGAAITADFALDPIAVLVTNGTQLTAESCATNGAIDPGETVTINVTLQNNGAAPVAALVATLLPSGGVVNPGPAQNYGAMPVGGAAVTRPFTLTAAANLTCGDPITLTFHLQDGAVDLGNVTVVLNAGAKRVALAENFDGVTAPALPAGWTTSGTGSQPPWTTAATITSSVPNSAFSPDTVQVGLNELVSPPIAILTGQAQLTFHNYYDLESTFLRNQLYDGAVLEIKMGSGAFQDIEAAGGSFVTGGYDGVISNCCQNPLANRRGWSGKSGPNPDPVFVNVKVNLPAAAAGQTIQLRWQVGTDQGTPRPGQFIDDVVVTDGYVCCAVASHRAVADFDGDGRTDLSVFRSTDSNWYVRRSSDQGFVSQAWGQTGDRIAPGDYDGDGKTDFAVFRPANAAWYILRSTDQTVTTVLFGLSDDVLAPADFDGDGKTDIAVFRPSTGTWYGLHSTDGSFFAAPWGLNGDVPAAGDYDGDGKADFAVFRPSAGAWYVLRSTDQGVTNALFGMNGDKPVAADFDGDGKFDFAVFRPSDGNWYISQSSNSAFRAEHFGLTADRPAPGDYDGDGKTDLVVFRPAEGNWYVRRSTDAAVTTQSFGVNGDSPVPSAYVP
jgi:hypothetical protein